MLFKNKKEAFKNGTVYKKVTMFCLLMKVSVHMRAF